MSDSLSNIFDVVPEEIRAWNPEIAPQAMVINTNGKSGPAIIGPPPPTYWENAGASSVGLATRTPTANKRIVPIFMYVLRYERGVSSIHIGRTDATKT